jgi:hypothetical protein
VTGNLPPCFALIALPAREVASQEWQPDPISAKMNTCLRSKCGPKRSRYSPLASALVRGAAANGRRLGVGTLLGDLRQQGVRSRQLPTHSSGQVLPGKEKSAAASVSAIRQQQSVVGCYPRRSNAQPLSAGDLSPTSLPKTCLACVLEQHFSSPPLAHRPAVVSTLNSPSPHSRLLNSISLQQQAAHSPSLMKDTLQCWHIPARVSLSSELTLVRESTVCLTCLALLTERFPVLRAGLVGGRDVNIDRITHQQRIIHPTLSAVPPTFRRPTHIPIDDEPARDTKLVNFWRPAGQQRSRKENTAPVISQ